MCELFLVFVQSHTPVMGQGPKIKSALISAGNRKHTKISFLNFIVFIYLFISLFLNSDLIVVRPLESLARFKLSNFSMYMCFH